MKSKKTKTKTKKPVVSKKVKGKKPQKVTTKPKKSTYVKTSTISSSVGAPLKAGEGKIVNVGGKHRVIIERSAKKSNGKAVYKATPVNGRGKLGQSVKGASASGATSLALKKSGVQVKSSKK